VTLKIRFLLRELAVKYVKYVKYETRRTAELETGKNVQNLGPVERDGM